MGGGRDCVQFSQDVYKPATINRQFLFIPTDTPAGEDGPYCSYTGCNRNSELLSEHNL